MKKYSFPPIVDELSKVLILGTMPGDVSLKKGQYYANPQNQFWKIVAAVVNEDPPFNYDNKRDLVIRNKIAIWDVLMHCEREGSLDSNIKAEFPNDFNLFFKKYSNIEAVFFNGGKSAKLFEKYNLTEKTKYYATLPSTSSANTSMTLQSKIEVWKEIMQYL